MRHSGKHLCDKCYSMNSKRVTYINYNFNKSSAGIKIVSGLRVYFILIFKIFFWDKNVHFHFVCWKMFGCSPQSFFKSGELVVTSIDLGAIISKTL